MSKKVLSTADGTLDWGDAREGDWVRVNGKRHRVEYKYWLGAGSLTAYYTDVETLKGLGAILERDAPPHPLEDAEEGTVIRADGGGVYAFDGFYWLETGYAAANDASDLLRTIGDDYEVIWPRPEPPKIEAGQVWRHPDGRCFLPTTEAGRLSLGAWGGAHSGPNWRSVDIATAEGLIAAGFRLDTEGVGS